MPAILTQHILPDPGPLARWRRFSDRRGPEVKILRTGGAEVVQIDLALPFGVSGGMRQKAYSRALACMAELGVREAVLPRPLEAEGLRLGLRPCDDLPVLRQMAARALLDCMGRQAATGQVRVFARRADRDVLSCVEGLAQRCRYLRLCGGAWADTVQARLLENFGMAAPGEGMGGCRAAVVFDAGFDDRGEAVILDLTRQGLTHPRAVRAALHLRTGETWLPETALYGSSRLLGSLVTAGALPRSCIDVRPARDGMTLYPCLPPVHGLTFDEGFGYNKM